MTTAYRASLASGLNQRSHLNLNLSTLRIVVKALGGLAWQNFRIVLKYSVLLKRLDEAIFAGSALRISGRSQRSGLLFGGRGCFASVCPAASELARGQRRTGQGSLAEACCRRVLVPIVGWDALVA